MATFEELQKKIAAAKFKKTVITHLVEYIDENFGSPADGTPKSCLLTDEKIAVPKDTFESLVTDLLKSGKDLDDEITLILQTPLNSQKQAPPPPAHETWAPQIVAAPQQQAAVLPFLTVPPPVQAPVPAIPVEQPTRAPRSRSRT